MTFFLTKDISMFTVVASIGVYISYICLPSLPNYGKLVGRKVNITCRDGVFLSPSP